MELRHLRYFVAVAEEGSFTDAARELCMAQPPLSAQIKALEKELDVKLFDRSNNRSIQLTDAGKIFLAEALAILDRVARATEIAQRVKRGSVGKLTLGIHNSFANSNLPKLVAQFHHQFPTVQLEFREVTVIQELQLLQNHQLDVVFHRSAKVYKDTVNFDYLPLLKEDFVLVLPEGHPLARRPTIPLTALHGESLILPDIEALPFYFQVIEACRQCEVEPKLDLDIRSGGIITLMSLVAMGLGISILPGHIKILHREGIVLRSIEGLDLCRHITLVWRKHDDSPVLKNFLDLIKSSTV
jgi:DNA-binding transcriptional LysR family regulator